MVQAESRMNENSDEEKKFKEITEKNKEVNK